jgi:hypothetical protein
MPRSIHASLIVLALLSACADTRTTSARRRAGPPPLPESPVSAQLERDTLSLPERLAREASEQPEARAEVERRIADFQAAGVSVTRTRQVLARLRGAHYCAIALTAAGLGLSVCAFASPEQAQEGLRRSRERFDRLIPGRSLSVAGSILLTVTQPPSAEAQREAELVDASFTQERAPQHAAL